MYFLKNVERENYIKFFFIKMFNFIIFLDEKI